MERLVKGLKLCYTLKNFKGSQCTKGVFSSSRSRAASTKLRDYQEECIQSVLSYCRRAPGSRVAVSLATGGGKTVIFTHLIDRLSPPRPEATRTLILVHRRELVEQSARHCLNTYPEKSVEIEMGKSHATGTADITIATVRSITSGERLRKYTPLAYKLILVDEAHHIVAPGYMQVLKWFGLLDTTKVASRPILVGVSATLSRFDGLRLGSALDHVVYHKDYLDMVSEKWLTGLVFTTVNSKTDLRRVRLSKTGDFAPSSLSRAVNTASTNELTVRAWLARAKGRCSTIVFCVDVAHVNSLTECFRQHGIDARSVTGKDVLRIRSRTLEGFKRHEFPVLVNCGVFTEGTDIPNIDCVLLARPTKSRNLLIQMIGRGMRLHENKANCHVIDMVSALSAGIISTPTLFGLDPSEVIQEVPADDLKGLRERRQRQYAEIESEDAVEALPSNVTFTDYSSVSDLIADGSYELHIRAISKLAWIKCGHDRYILSDKDRGLLTVEKTEDESSRPPHDRFSVKFAGKLETAPEDGKWRPFKRNRIVATAKTFEDAVHAADTFAKENFIWKMVSTNQEWRKWPASPAQLKLLNGYRSDSDQYTPETLTKGKATDMITKLKYGAVGRFKEVKAQERREERARVQKEADEEKLRRELVKVGPLV